MKKKSLNVKKIILKKLLIKLNNPKIKKIYNVFSNNLNHFKNNTKVAVALSGGKDSLALAYLAKCYSIKNNIKFFFYHVDHGLRTESSIEASQLMRQMKFYDIKCKILKWKGAKPVSNIQSVARNKRYSLLNKECIKNNIKLLLTGHHIDDVYENFIIRLTRGSGLKGLISFYSIKAKDDRNLKILRPLYQFKKKELEYIWTNIFKFSINDSSNSNLNYKRVRIRKLLSNLKNEGLDESKFKLTMQNLLSAENSINNYVDENLQYNSYLGKNNIYVIKSDFFKEPSEIIFRSLSIILSKIGNSYYPPRGKNLQKLINSINSVKFKKATLSGCIIEKVNNSVKIYKENTKFR